MVTLLLFPSYHTRQGFFPFLLSPNSRLPTVNGETKIHGRGAGRLSRVKRLPEGRPVRESPTRNNVKHNDLRLRKIQICVEPIYLMATLGNAKDFAQ